MGWTEVSNKFLTTMFTATLNHYITSCEKMRIAYYAHILRMPDNRLFKRVVRYFNNKKKPKVSGTMEYTKIWRA